MGLIYMWWGAEGRGGGCPQCKKSFIYMRWGAEGRGGGCPSAGRVSIFAIKWAGMEGRNSVPGKIKTS